MLVEHGGHGGDAAAPLAMEIVNSYFETVAPADRDAPRIGVPKRRLTSPVDAAALERAKKLVAADPDEGPAPEAKPSPEAKP